MKTIGVIIITVMILLNFAQADEADGFLCNAKCKIKCEEQPFPEHYAKCMKDCLAHCTELSNPVYNCITGCRLMKSIVIKNGMYSKSIFFFFFNFFLYICFY